MTFAYMSLLECDGVAAGERTWEQSISDAVSDGVAPATAERFVAVLRDEFCPVSGVSAPAPSTSEAAPVTTDPSIPPVVDPPPADDPVDTLEIYTPDMDVNLPDCPTLDDLRSVLSVTADGEDEWGTPAVRVKISVNNPRNYPVFLSGELDYRASNGLVDNMFPVDFASMHDIELKPGPNAITLDFVDYGEESHHSEVVWTSWSVWGYRILDGGDPKCEAVRWDNSDWY